MEIQWVEEILHHQKDGWNMLKPYQLVQDKPPINWWFRNHPQYDTPGHPLKRKASLPGGGGGSKKPPLGRSNASCTIQ